MDGCDSRRAFLSRAAPSVCSHPDRDDGSDGCVTRLPRLSAHKAGGVTSFPINFKLAVIAVTTVTDPRFLGYWADSIASRPVTAVIYGGAGRHHHRTQRGSSCCQHI